MLDELKADLARFPGSGLPRLRLALANPGFYVIALYRFGHFIYHRAPRVAAIPGKLIYKVAEFFMQWATGIFLSPAAMIGPGFYIGHWGCIRVSAGVRIGANCNIGPMVILGFGISKGKRGVPCLGDRVYIAAGAKVVGPVRIGNDVAVGANAVVCRDVPDHVSVGGIPARIISNKGSVNYISIGQPLEVRPADVNEVKPAMRPTTPAPPP